MIGLWSDVSRRIAALSEAQLVPLVGMFPLQEKPAFHSISLQSNQASNTLPASACDVRAFCWLLQMKFAFEVGMQKSKAQEKTEQILHRTKIFSLQVKKLDTDLGP